MRDSTSSISQLRRLRFSGELEKAFLDDYFESSVVICRAALFCSTFLFVAFGLLDPYAIPSALKQVWMLRYGVVLPVLVALIALTYFPVFRRIMQPAVGLILMVVGCGVIGMTVLARPDELGYLLYPMGLLLVPMIGYAFVRLRFWYATIPNLINVAVYFAAAIYYQDMLSTPRGAASIISQAFFIVSMNIIGIATCYLLEFYARRAFLANYLLEQERAGEQRKREHTESMLLVLSRAIGGVVHDLGNPLTAVQVGAHTLEMYLDSGLDSRDELKELTHIIGNGAEMLDHLRLSLMEQTRVLEGKPIPVELVPVDVRASIEAGIAFQKPQNLSGRAIVLGGEAVEIQADAMKMTTVWMNLLGNALKYSDGDVRVQWRVAGDWLLVAVGDTGKNGRGISHHQAQQLFVAFGRLDFHASIEGTGLGLLSVRRIVEAHGGEVFIEGLYSEGLYGEGLSNEELSSETAANSPSFTTAGREFPSMLDAKIRTAFVVAFPLQNP